MKHRSSFYLVISVLTPLLLAVLSGCDDGFKNDQMANQPPNTWVASGPPDSSTSEFRVHLFWGGFDPDGEVKYFEYVVTNNPPGGLDPADTTGPEKWRRIAIRDSIFIVSADLPKNPGSPPGNPKALEFQRTHTFFIRSVDDKGRTDPTPAYRSFTAETIAPEVNILTPVNPRPGDIHALPNNVTFTWEATDEGGTLQADSVRYALFKSAQDNALSLTTMMDTLFERIDDPLWSKWIWTQAPDDSGSKVVLKNISFPPTSYYAFVVQAKDLAGAVTPTYDDRRNVRKIQSTRAVGPILNVQEKLIGVARFLGENAKPTILNVPAGLQLEFSWDADASGTGLTISGFRYGWDIVDPDDPSEWPVQSDPTIVRAPAVTWSFGQHLLLVEARDSGGGITLGRIQVNVIPFPMARPILYVDDSKDAILCTDRQQRPLDLCDSEHDTEWLNVLSHVEGFDPNADVYDVSLNAFRVPPIELIANYQNILWVTTGREVNPGIQPDALNQVIKFTPKCLASTKVEINSAAVFLGKGGHLWVCGKNPISTATPVSSAGAEGRFPSVMQNDYMRDCPGPGGQVDTSGVFSFPYRDVGLVAVDQSTGTEDQYRDGVSGRNARDDGLFECTAINPEFPQLDSLEVSTGLKIAIGLPSLVGRDIFHGSGGGHTDPVTGDKIGFPASDIFDSQYWLKTLGGDVPLRRPEAFVPVWKHLTKGNSILAKNLEVNGGWSLVHAWREADLPGGRKGVMAMSMYMGFMPYYFEIEKTNLVANYVFFKEWQLRYLP